MAVLEIMLGAVLALLCRMIWRIGGHSPRAGLLIAAVLIAFSWPWLADADWGRLLRVLGALAVAGALLLGYAWLLGRLRAASARREER